MIKGIWSPKDKNKNWEVKDFLKESNLCSDECGCEECVRQPELVLGEECSRGRENEFKTLGTVVPLTSEEPKNYSEGEL